MREKKIYLLEGYRLAGCCSPEPGDQISGYYSYNNEIIVHCRNCGNLDKIEMDRIINLDWDNILAVEPERPGGDFAELDEIDFMILAHHEKYGNDYSLKVAAMLHRPKQEIFGSHTKLREMRLLKRVEPLMIRYRKGIVDNKWIKHRNHTYYELTDKSRHYLDYYRKNDMSK